MNLIKSTTGHEATSSNPNGEGKRQTIDLQNGSEVVLIPRFLSFEESWKWFHYLNKEIPWTRPIIRVFGRSCVQPRDTCYIASSGLPELGYSGYQPHAYSWDDFPPLKDILEAVHKTFPGSSFNSLLLNRYKGGNDYVGWHADDEKLYGSTPEIVSVSFGCDREFLLRKKPSKIPQVQINKRVEGEPPSKQLKKNSQSDQHSFTLKHGSLLLMRGYTQRDWVHSVPKRAKAEATRINLTFSSGLIDPEQNCYGQLCFSLWAYVASPHFNSTCIGTLSEEFHLAILPSVAYFFPFLAVCILLI